MLKRLLVFPLLIAWLPSFHAIDFWSADYYAGFSFPKNESAAAVEAVCSSLIAWGHGSYEGPSDDSILLVASRARHLFRHGDHFGAGLLLCHSMQLWLPSAGAPLEHTLISSNLLGMSLWESSHFAGARAAFNMADAIMSKMSNSGADIWAVEVDTLDSAEALMPAPTAVFMNAGRVAADSLDFAAANEFFERSKINLEEDLPSSQQHPSPGAKARASMLQYTKDTIALQEKSGSLHHTTLLVNHALNISSMVRALRESPAHATVLASLQSTSLWTAFSPEANFKYYISPLHIVEGIIQDLLAIIDDQKSIAALEAAVGALDALVSMKASSHCRLAIRAQSVDSLLRVVAASRTSGSHVFATAFSALGHLVSCDGALSFVTAYGIEVMSHLIRHGSKAERLAAAKLMKEVVKNTMSMIDRSMIQKHVIYRTVFRTTLNMAPSDIFHRQQSGTSLKAEDALVKTLTKKSRFFAIYWKMLAATTNLMQSLSAGGDDSLSVAHNLITLRLRHESTHERLAWFHSGAQEALVSFFGGEEEASQYVLDSIPEQDRLQFQATPGLGDPGVYDPSGTLEHFDEDSNHRDASMNPPCAGLATNLLQCWFYKVSMNLAEGECADESLLTCHHFHGKKDQLTFPNISVPDFSTSIVARDGIILVHLLDLYFTASLSVYGEWSALESDLIALHVPSGGVFLDIGAHVGTISTAIARHVGKTGKVIAVEVQSNFCELIRQTADANSMPQLVVENAAIAVSSSMCVTAAVSSAIAMPTNFGGFEVSSCTQYHKRLMLTKKQRHSPSPTFSSDFGAKHAVVSSVTIDSIVKTHGLTSLDAIKLDCEGSEHLALQGGQEALKRFHPAIFFEDNDVKYHDGGTSKPYAPTSSAMQAMHTAILQPLGYVCTSKHAAVYNPHNHRGQSVNIFGIQASVVITCTTQSSGAGSADL